MGKFLNFLLVVACIILVILIAVNYFADKEIAKYRVNPATVTPSSGDEINDIIHATTDGAKRVTTSVSKKISTREPVKNDTNSQNSQTSKPSQNTIPSKSLPQVPKNVNQTYFNSSKN